MVVNVADKALISSKRPQASYPAVSPQHSAKFPRTSEGIDLAIFRMPDDDSFRVHRSSNAVCQFPGKGAQIPQGPMGPLECMEHVGHMSVEPVTEGAAEGTKNRGGCRAHRYSAPIHLVRGAQRPSRVNVTGRATERAQVHEFVSR